MICVPLLSTEEAATCKELAADKGDSVQVYHNLVVQNIMDSERTYVQELKVRTCEVECGTCVLHVCMLACVLNYG